MGIWRPVGRCTVGDTKPKHVFVVAEKGISNLGVRLNSNTDFELSRRHWDFAEGDGGGVKFSLRSNISFWEENLNPSYFVLNVLKHGYLLPLKQKPPSYFAQNNHSALKNATFVQNAIETLLSHGLIEELLTPAYCCNPLTVADKGKRRLVLDLRHVKEYLRLRKFRYDDLRVVADKTIILSNST